MSRSKKILLALAAILVVIQFIRPERNTGEPDGANSIVTKYAVPDNVHAVLKQSCYDCHSNHTEYPWYANIQPVGWWIQFSHVNDGKRHLNFSEYATYNEKRSKRKFEEIADEVKEGGMPLSSYTMMHGNAKLTEEQSKLVIDWATALAASGKAGIAEEKEQH